MIYISKDMMITWKLYENSKIKDYWLKLNESTLGQLYVQNANGPVVSGLFYSGVPPPGLILGLRPANERRHYFICNDVSHWLGASLESAKSDSTHVGGENG